MAINPQIIPSASDAQKFSQISQNFQEILNTQFIIVGEDTLTISGFDYTPSNVGWDTGAFNTTQPHNFNYTPLAIAFIEIDDFRIPLNYTQTEVAPHANVDFMLWEIRLLVNSTGVTLKTVVTSEGTGSATITFGAVPVRYFLYRRAID